MDESRTVIDSGAIAIKDSIITDIGKEAEFAHKHKYTRIIDAQGKVVTPGFVNTHTHMFQGLLKGLGDDRVLVDWFRKVTGPSAANLTPEDCSASAMLGCLEAIRSGATTVLDFMYPHHRNDLSEPIIKAMIDSGIRGVYCRGFIDRGEEEGVPKQIIEESNEALMDCRQLHSRFDGTAQGRINVWVAPCMIWTQSEEGLKATRELANETGMKITIHIAETNYEVENANLRFGMSELPYLSKIGFLGSDVLAVHCVNLNQRDIRILRHFDIKVSHNPISNMYLSSGVAPVPEMLLAGITVGLATDGPASNNNQNIIQTLKFAALLQKVATKDPTVITAEKVLEMATIDGAKALGMEKQIGSIEVGKKADIVIIDLNNPFAAPVHNPVSSLVYASTGCEVDTVIIDGEIIMEYGKLLTMDEELIINTANNAANDLAKRSGTARFQKRLWESFAI